MAKFSEQRRYVLRVIQPSTCSTLGEYDSRPTLARYVWYFTSYLRSSCCSETHVCPRLLPVFLPLSTLDVTHMRKCTRPSPLYRTASDEKLGDGLGTRLLATYMYMYTHNCIYIVPTLLMLTEPRSGPFTIPFCANVQLRMGTKVQIYIGDVHVLCILNTKYLAVRPREETVSKIHSYIRNDRKILFESQRFLTHK